MRSFLAASALTLLLFLPALPQNGSDPFAGRWDITVTAGSQTYPDWMEVVDNGGTLKVRVQPRAGSVHPVTDAKVEGSRLVLTLEPGTTWELTASGNKLTGTQKGSHAAQLSAVRAPALDRKPPAAWSDPEPIFDGKDLNGWEPTDPSANHWIVQDGAMVNQSKGSNIKSTRKFEDFKLHIEYLCPQGGNSGVYLRGRYEVQVEYEPPEANDNFHKMGSIYGFLAPSVQLPKKPGQWETYDVTLVGRHVTVIRDGTTIIDNQEIPGITGGALDANEGEPGPFYFQGDHTGGMKYRNIRVSVPKR